MNYKTVIFFIAIFSLSCGNKKKEEKTIEVFRPVRYSQIIQSGGRIDQSFSGTAQSSKEAQLSFKVNGTISKLRAKVGDKVSKGQVIAVIDASDYNVQYEQAVANLKSVQTQIKSAESQRINTASAYKRVETLYENNGVSLSEFEQAKSAKEGAEAQYEAALAQFAASEKQVESARNQVAYAKLNAPFSGVITTVFVEENELVGSGVPIAALSALTKPEVRVGVPEVFITKITAGQKVDIAFSTLPDHLYKGTVSEVGFSAAASTYPVIITIDDPGKDIRPGMTANVYFKNNKDAAEKPYLIAPVQAVGEGSDGQFVFVLEKENEHYKVRKQSVKIGTLLPDGFEIKEGVKAGDLVATAGLNSLLPGMKVKLLEN